MATINPYLNFMGKSEEAFNFYKSVFGGEFEAVTRFKDTEHGQNMSAEDKEKIMHIALPIGGNLLMATDCLDSMGQTLTFGNNFSISFTPDSMEHTNQVFNDLAKGGQVTMPIEKMFWGDWFGMITDNYGVQWMINYNDGAQK